jgi:DNA-binding MarR family transcriptional regulator/DNA-binding XRE family transcriptional regulator
MDLPPIAAVAPWAALLKARRSECGWSQRELAARAGVHQPQVARAERGDDLQLSVLARIAAPLGLAPTLGVPAAQPEPEADDTVQHSVESWQRAWPTVDPQVFAAFARLSRLGQIVERDFAEVAAAHGVSSGDTMVLGALRRMGPPYESTPTGLKQLLWISLPGLKKRIDKLEALGLVERVDNPLDGRGQMVRMTQRGHATLDEMITHPAPVFEALQALDAGERRTLSDTLRRLLQKLEQPEQG